MTREEAIKWLKNCALTECEDCKYINEPDDWCDIQVMRIARMLETLPNEVVRCKDCRRNNDGNLCDIAYYINEDGDGFCNCGERREP